MKWERISYPLLGCKKGLFSQPNVKSMAYATYKWTRNKDEILRLMISQPPLHEHLSLDYNEKTTSFTKGSQGSMVKSGSLQKCVVSPTLRLMASNWIVEKVHPTKVIARKNSFILLMEKIPDNHLGWLKHVKTLWIVG